MINEALFLECLDTLQENTSLPKRFFLAKRVRRRLQVYSKYHLAGLVSAYGQFLWEKLQSFLTHRRKNKSLKTGGAVIAFVGAEATGKSTLVSETENWLTKIFSTRSVHAGKPPATWMTAPLNLILPLLRRLLPQLRTTQQDGKSAASVEIISTPVIKGWTGLIYAVRSVSLAWDRRHLLS